MKKHLKINEFIEKDVPSALDARILFAASMRSRRRRSLRRWQIGSSIAAAAVAACTAVIFMLPENDPQIVQPAKYSKAELLAMSDFTRIEQETFAIAQLSLAMSDSSADFKI